MHRFILMNSRSRNILATLSLTMLFACIKPFDPAIDSNAANKYVVSGRVTNTEGWQAVGVSLSSPIESPEYIPVSSCQVTIADDKGTMFPMEEYVPGLYRVWMRQLDLVPGTSYQVKVITPEGELLESGFDRMSTGPPIDSVYYRIEDIPTTGNGSRTVMQFYVDLNAVGNYSQYYQWEIVETWEYEAAHPVEFYYDGTFHEVKPPDYTNKVCWITQLVRNIFTVSTRSLSQNIYNHYPLQTIDGTSSSRLGIMYSTLVRQLALSEGAYNYWDELRINSNELGGLYEKQPFAVKGNLVNLSSPDKDVLGYFYAAAETTRRYFYHDVEGIVLDYNRECYEQELVPFFWRDVTPREYPIYYYYNESGALRILNLYCVDCRKQGGTTVKPVFWP
ncbi:MAG: DUF4249 domain-containing protein [Methanosarcina sp.]|nr:MAG: DUF4249 domain-containing protein [Methanosarcina sp.]